MTCIWGFSCGGDLWILIGSFGTVLGDCAISVVVMAVVGAISADTGCCLVGALCVLVCFDLGLCAVMVRVALVMWLRMVVVWVMVWYLLLGWCC